MISDHLIGAGEQRWWDDQSECLCGLEVDHEFKLFWLLHWQVCRLFALEYACGVDPSLPIGIEKVCSTTCQAAGIGELAPLIDCRPAMARCEGENVHPLAAEECISADQ